MMAAGTVRLAMDGEVFCWNQRRGIPRVYEQMLPRLRAGHPGIEVAVHVQGRLQARYLAGLGIRVQAVRMLPRTLRPWRLWDAVAPAVDAALRRRHWRRVRADVYHSTHYTLPRVRGPMFTMVHDMIPELFPARFPRGAGARIAAARRRTLARADRVLCVSANTRDDVVRLLHVPPERCVVNLNAATLDPGIAQDHALTPAEPFLLYVGGYRVPYKNFDFLVEALATAEGRGLGVGLVVAGPEAPTPRETARLDAALGAGRARFATACSDEQLASLYAHCAALVMPSLYEGFGLPVIEAMVFGAPVVCSDRASLPEVGGAEAHYCNPQSPASLLDALRQALAEGRAPEAVERRARQAAECSWERNADVFARTVVELAEGAK